MKKVLLLLFLFATTKNWGQASIKIAKNGKDTIVVFNQDSSINKQRSVDNMPNALQGRQDKLQLIGNNSQGFDLYQSSIDNMMILKPDANNAASLNTMPVAAAKTTNGLLKLQHKNAPTLTLPQTPNNKPKVKGFKLEQLPQ
jgi:hypothetical protein